MWFCKTKLWNSLRGWRLVGIIPISRETLVRRSGMVGICDLSLQLPFLSLPFSLLSMPFSVWFWGGTDPTVKFKK